MMKRSRGDGSPLPPGDPSARISLNHKNKLNLKMALKNQNFYLFINRS